MRRRIIYVHDPLCGWCYGFGPHISHAAEVLNDFEVVVELGGLVTQDRIAPYRTIEPYLQSAIPQLREATGAVVGDRFATEMIGSQTLMSSNPPSAAIMAVRAHQANATLPFTRAIQDAHFLRGADLNEPDLYPELADQIGIAGVEMTIPGPNDETAALSAEYATTRKRGARSFPSLFLEITHPNGRVQTAPTPVTYDGTALVASIREANAYLS